MSGEPIIFGIDDAKLETFFSQIGLKLVLSRFFETGKFLR